MSLWRRFTESVNKRGLLKTARLAPRALCVFISKFEDQFYDIRNRTDTFEIIELDGLDIQSANKRRGIRYEPTRARPFFKVMNDLALPTHGQFVDFGCGKGRVLMMASECGFKKITGVDFSQELCERAKENICAYKARHHNDADIEVINSDAVDHKIKPDDTIFYFFNPFDELVFGKILDNITDSLNAAPRNIWIIYHNPLWRHVIERWTIFNEIASFKIAECEFVVYSNKE
jgi:SAM-dependent methyltransferase